MSAHCPRCGWPSTGIDGDICEQCCLPYSADGEPSVKLSPMRMFVWSSKPDWIAVAQAETVEQARILLLDSDLVGGTDKSCPVRARAQHHIKSETPSIWVGPNAEFELTDSAAIEEADTENARLLRHIDMLRTALAKIAGRNGYLWAAECREIAEKALSTRL